MNNDDLILAELRKMSAWFDFHRKVTKWSMIGLGLVFFSMIPLAFFMDHEVKKAVNHVDAADWYDVDRAVRAGDFDNALKIGEELIQKAPLNPATQHRLGDAYLAAGKLDKAHEHYAEAYRLFPSDENKNLLATLENRIEGEKAKH